jgi:hypothetical protein
MLGVADLEAGRYLVQYDGVFASVPLTPPALRLTPLEQASEEHVAHVVGEVGVLIENRGLEDAPTVLVEVEAAQDGMEPTTGFTRTVSILSGASIPVRFEWAPTQAGRWWVQVRALAFGDDGAALGEVTADWDVAVAPVEDPPLLETLSAFGLVEPAAVALLLGATATAGAVVILMALRAQQAKGKPPQRPLRDEQR